MSLCTKIKIDKDELYDLFINKKLNKLQIAKIYNCGPDAIARRLERYKIQDIKTRYVYPKSDFTNRKFGKLLIVSFSHRDRNRNKIIWNCLCECGRTCQASSEMLLTKKHPKRSCGCSLKLKRLPPNEYFPPNLLSRIKSGAIKRKLEFNVTSEYLYELFINQNKKCIFTKIELSLGNGKGQFRTASLDRIDSNKGYIIGNVQWVHKKVNMMKQAMLDKEFIDLCKVIAKNYE